MPLYDYKCNSCNHTFSEIYKIADRDIPINSPCPNCKLKNSVQQVIGAPTPICPIRLGRIKPHSDFRERMKQIKYLHRYTKNNIKDY